MWGIKSSDVGLLRLCCWMAQVFPQNYLRGTWKQISLFAYYNPEEQQKLNFS